MEYSPPPLLDPDLTASDLARIASQGPQAWPQILAHPNCYPELSAWISSQATTPKSSPMPGTDGVDGAKQMKQAAKQFAAGAQGFYKEKIAPTVGQASSAASAAWMNRKASPREAAKQWAPIVLVGAALLGIISLFLPLFSYGGVSLSYFSDELGGSDGPVLLVALLLVVGLAIACLVRPKKWLRITTGVVSILVGLFLFVPVVNVSSQIDGRMGASLGLGPIVAAIVGVLIIAAAIASLLPDDSNSAGPRGAK